MTQFQSSSESPLVPNRMEVSWVHRSILECLSDGILISNQSGIITNVNQTAVSLLGGAADSIIDQPIVDLLPRLPLLAPTGSDTANTRMEVNGRILQAQVNLIYDETGEAQGTVAILRDITAQDRAQRAKNNFLATISHELRTPLTAIKGYTELLAGGAGGALSDEQKTFTNTILRNVTRMVQLINSLIFASSLKSGHLEHTADYADLTQLIQQISREQQPAAAENGLQILVNLDPNLRPIQADSIHLATILEELITNAIKYNRPGGRIRVKAVLQDAPDEVRFVVVSVSDDGIGIDPADQAYVFEEFFRPEGQEQHIQARGMGMGLSIVQALVEAYNGRIWFESIPNQGSTFTFIIPAQQPKDINLLPTTAVER
ncbi:MAG: sensor histidine kinase [Anaerolineae bacterium]